MLFKRRQTPSSRPKPPPEDRTLSLRGQNIDYRLVRSSRKTLGFEIKQGQLWVRAPMNASIRWIENVLLERADWIVGHLERQVAHIAEHQPSPYQRASLSWLGEERPLTIRAAKRNEVLFDGEVFFVYLGSRSQKPEQARVDGLLSQWCQSEAKTYLKARTEHWAKVMQVHPSGIEVKSFKRMWGRCSSKGEVALNWRLMLASPKAIDYVVIHELAHLSVFNHSPAFWQRVAQFCPDYDVWRRYFNERGSWLSWKA